MQELIYSLNYVLERMDLLRNLVDIEVEKVSIIYLPFLCVICVGRTVKVCVTFVELPGLFRHSCIIFRASKK